MNYYAKEISACESRILDKVDIIKRYGMSVSEYEERLQNIMDSTEVNDDEINQDDVAVAAMQNEMANIAILNKLKELEAELDSYQCYLKVHFRNSSLINEIKGVQNITSDKLDLYVSEAKSLLHDVWEANVDSVKATKKIIRDVYSTIYEIIKLELLLNGKSELLDFIVKDNQGVCYINDLVRDEINRLRENESLDENIKKVMDELSQVGIDYDFADEELILLLALHNKELVLANFQNQTDLYDQKIKTLKDYINRANYNRETACDDKDIYEHRRNKSIRRSVISSIVLALNILLSNLAPGVAREMHTTTTYMATREAYDTVTGNTRHENIYLPKSEAEYAELKVFGEVDETGRRTVTVYDLSDMEEADLADYPQMITDDTRHVSSQSEKYRLGEQLSRDEYMVVERMNYGEAKEEFDAAAYNKDLMYTLMLIYFFEGLSAVAILKYLLRVINNNRMLKETIQVCKKNDSEIGGYNRELEYYKKLKKDLTKLKDDYMEDQLNPDDYKRMVRK